MPSSAPLDSCSFFLLALFWQDSSGLSATPGSRAIGFCNLVLVRCEHLRHDCTLNSTREGGPVIFTGIMLGIAAVSTAQSIHFNSVHKVVTDIASLFNLSLNRH
jgi:hypothetical protein